MNDHCFLCKSGEYNIIATKLRNNKVGNVVSCSSCGLVRLLGIPELVKKLNDYYSEQYAKDYYYINTVTGNDSLFESFLPVQADRVRRLRSYIKPSDRVLEIGSNVGYFLYSIKPLVAEVQGLELNKSAARYANEVKNIPTSSLPLEESDLPKGYYDHIFIFHVLEHTSNPIEFLTLLRKFLRPGGMIHIEVPNFMDPLVNFYEVEEYRNFFYQEPHLYYFTSKTLTMLCEAAQYRPVSIYGYQQTSFMNNLKWVYMRTPQKSRWDCIQSKIPDGSIRSDVHGSIKKRFDDFMEEVNGKYIKFMEDNGFGDMLLATIAV